MSNNSEVLNLLGLATRARKTVSGETLFKMIAKKQVYLVIMSLDASDNSKKKVHDKCHFYNCDCIDCFNIDDLSLAIGKNNRVAVGIVDKGFADKIKSRIGG